MKKIVYTIIISCLLCQGFGQVSIGSGAQWVSNGSISITLQDMNLVNDGSISGTGSFKFSGLQNSTIAGSGSSYFGILEMAKTNNATLQLNKNIHVSAAINFTAGLLDLNGNNMLMDATANINGESESSRIIGPLGGYVEIIQNLNAPSSVNPGNLGAIITSNENMGTVTIRRGHQAQIGSGLTSSITRHYNITPSFNSNIDATLRLKYFDAELNGQNENLLVIWQFNPLYDGANWQNLSHSGRDATSNYVQRAGINNLYLATLANDYIISTATRNSDVKAATAAFLPTVKKKITVGPNPNNGNFWFSINGIEKETIAHLYTIDGKQINQFRVVNLQQQHVNNLRSGIYLLKVGGFETQKIIVNAGINSGQQSKQIITDNYKL